MPARPFRLAIALAVALGVLALTLGHGAATDAAPASATVQISLTGAAKPVPKAFFGISAEANELPAFEAGSRLFGRFLDMVRPRDGSRMLLRVGGTSTDEALWNVAPTSHDPHWVFELSPPWLDRLVSLVKHQNLRVMLDLNLVVHSPTMAAAFARAAARTLPAGRLAALGIGNEPDLYSHQLKLDGERIPSTLSSTPMKWAEGYAPANYHSDYAVYARAVHAVAPHTPLFGPDTTSSTSPAWVDAISHLGADSPSVITVHRYPFSKCYKRSSPFYPTVARLMRPSATAGLAGRLRAPLSLAQARGAQLRVSELNSISCGGQDGVADTFATALWAPDALFELMRNDVAGVNWHIRPALNNAPFHFGPHGFEAQPELYGLAVFNSMIGHGSELLQLNRVDPSGQNVKAWAVRTGRTLKLLLINKSSSRATVVLPQGTLAPRPAEVSDLFGRSLAAESGIAFAGRMIGSDARWHGRHVTASVRPAAGRYRFTLAPYSAQVIRLSYPG